MSILSDMLADSRKHYLGVQARIHQRLKRIPRGSVQKRRLPRGGDYYYLAVRQGPRVVNKYIGKEQPAQLIKQIEERRLLLKRLKDLRGDIAILKRLRWERPRAKRHR